MTRSYISGDYCTVSEACTRALIESAAVIARPTPRAPGIDDFDNMLSCCRSLSVSRFTR